VTKVIKENREQNRNSTLTFGCSLSHTCCDIELMVITFWGGIFNRFFSYLTEISSQLCFSCWLM